VPPPPLFSSQPLALPFVDGALTACKAGDVLSAPRESVEARKRRALTAPASFVAGSARPGPAVH
jgi:hypothetical protein